MHNKKSSQHHALLQHFVGEQKKDESPKEIQKMMQEKFKLFLLSIPEKQTPKPDITKTKDLNISPKEEKKETPPFTAPKKSVSTHKKKTKPLKNKPSFFQELWQISLISTLLFVVTFAGFNYSSIISLSEKYWNAEEYKEKQQALEQFATKDEQKEEKTNESEELIQKVKLLPVAGSKAENNLPELDLSIRPPETRIIIPKIGKNIPIINVSEDSLRAEQWDQLEEEIQDGLRDGVVHYPGTAEPGQYGNVFITGHSSYYPWDLGRYKDVFAALHDLEVGDEYYILHKERKYKYRITERKVVKPEDVSVLHQPATKKVSTLMTCTPIGTIINRLVLVAEEVSEEH